MASSERVSCPPLPQGPAPWVNWGGNQRMWPKETLRATSLATLQDITRHATNDGRRVRVVGSGLSFSDVLKADDILVDTSDLLGVENSGLLPTESDLWREPQPRKPRVRIACGAKIRLLNATLAQAGLAFTNLGGYDMQTMVGAIATSTHGSGLRLGALPDAVISLDLVTQSGDVVRIEPTDGPTDRAKFEQRYGSTMRLEQADALFHAVVVAMGCMGIIYSVTMEVSPAFRLVEHRRLKSWSTVKLELEESLTRFRNYEVFLNPYPRRDGDYDCLVTERDVAPPDAPTIPLPAGRRLAEGLTFLSSTQEGLVRLMTSEPRLIPGLLQTGLSILPTSSAGHIDQSYRIYHAGQANTTEVISGEYFFPLHNRRFAVAIERLLGVIDENRQKGLYQPGPLCMRFIAGSKAPLSMVRGEAHGSVEIAIFRDLPGAIDMILSYEQACLDLCGRPHWAQINELTGRPGWLRGAYPQLDTWLMAYRRFNSKGTFNNHFTDRLGLSMPSENLP